MESISILIMIKALLCSINTLIHLLYTYSEPYRLVKLNISTLHAISNAILPFHYNDTTFRQEFFLLRFSDDQIFISYTEDEGKPTVATWLQTVDLRSMKIVENLKQNFSHKQFTDFPLVQAISNQNKIIVNLWQWSEFLITQIL